jgi:murein DD-endopeptidase MepM/ murein hydrolase activator NlpD
VIGKVGNSGNSSAPHLHFQISNSPSFLGSDAIPYGFNHFFIEAEYDKAQQKLINLPVPKKATDELALENTVVGF